MAVRLSGVPGGKAHIKNLRLLFRRPAGLFQKPPAGGNFGVKCRSTLRPSEVHFKMTMATSTKLKPAARVAGSRQDVWWVVNPDLGSLAHKLTGRKRSIVNEAAAASPVQPIVNMGQGFFGYNPPKFILDAAKQALDRVDCNQYSPTKGRPRLKKAISDAYAPFWGRKLDPETEVTITTGANEGGCFWNDITCWSWLIVSKACWVLLWPLSNLGMRLSSLSPSLTSMFNPGKVPWWYKVLTSYRYISNIQMAGGKIMYVPMHPPKEGDVKTLSAAEWTIDFDQLEKAFTPRTKMIVLNTPRRSHVLPSIKGPDWSNW
jgi:kynurenine aminotransferase